MCLFIAYLAVLFKLLFFKLTLNFSDISIGGNSKASFKTLWDDSNFVPFYRIYYYTSGQEPYLVGAFEVFGNILVFVPMGFFMAYFFPVLRNARRLLVFSAVLCLCIETVQLLTATGQFDADDVLLNVLGIWLGNWMYRKSEKFFALPLSGADRRTE